MKRGLVVAACASLVLLVSLTVSLAQAPSANYEVWVIDQADAANGGDRLYIYTPPAWDAPPQVIELVARAAGVGDGAGNRAHLLMFNRAQTHGLLANVATGHLYVIRASDRSIVASIDVGEQLHGADASADDRWIIGANQNGKKLVRIRADFANEVFTHNPADDLDLGALEDEGHPDNAPICPVMYVGPGGKAYVTLRGGGLYVVDTLATPMRITRSYSRDEVPPAGCGGETFGNRVWINSGSATSGHLHVFDAVTDNLIATVETTSWGTDAHGGVIIGGRHIWMASRGDGDNILVIDARTLQVLNVIEDVGPAPDLMHVSPDGQLVFVSLRGPKALTGGPSAIGETPGLAIMAVEQGGLSGRRIGFVPIGPQTPDSDADPHALRVRTVPRGK